MYIFLFFQSSIMSLSQQKSDLFHTNVEIHNFLAELSCCPGVIFNTPPSSLGRKDKQQHYTVGFWLEEIPQEILSSEGSFF